MAAVVLLLQLRDNPTPLVVFVVGVVPNNLFALTQIRPQLFRFSLDIVGDDRIGRIQNGLGAAVVLCQNHRCHFGKRGFKLQNVAEVGATKSVHTLVGVTHNTHIVVKRAKHQHDGVLRHVRVLVFVDQNMFKAFLI
ncbi:unannotated protein [freshwater metagenome]|uniref:Unannotated protein n=1 Tax=freshwater metagenome TaxID=449393 RepID=A0A6J7N8Q0_9ZZZZ